ncbi:hypothetical protein SANTM175S_01755 [Streptomyces antimycoticus]
MVHAADPMVTSASSRSRSSRIPDHSSNGTSVNQANVARAPSTRPVPMPPSGLAWRASDARCSADSHTQYVPWAAAAETTIPFNQGWLVEHAAAGPQRTRGPRCRRAGGEANEGNSRSGTARVSVLLCVAGFH